MPSEENVAPDTTSTAVDCLATICAINPWAREKYSASSSCDTTSIWEILPPLMVTATVMVLL